MATITGKLETIVGEGPEVGSIEIALCGYGSQVPRAPSSLLARVSAAPIVPGSDGTFTVEVPGNDAIIPTGTYYTATVRNTNGDITQCNAYLFLDTQDYDLDSTPPFDPALPIQPLPPAIINQLQIVPASPDPGYDGSQYTTWKITLNQDVTDGWLANIVPGNLYTFIIVQDSAGGHQFSFPVAPYPLGTQNVTEICMAPNSVTIQTFVADDRGVLWSIAPGTWCTP